MTKQEWIELFRTIPQSEHNKLVVVLQNGTDLSVDTLHRFEPNFLVMRGRVGGTIDEARGFFVPYDQMLYVRLERIVKLDELESMFVKPGTESVTPTVEQSANPTPLMTEKPPLKSLPQVQVAPTDPAAASRMLLEKIRAARTQGATKFPSQG